MASFVMVCQGLAHDGSGPVGQYLKSYDPELFDGRGAINWTAILDQAKRYSSPAHVLEEWKSAPACHPIRLTDGMPNRPLTAYSVSIERVDP